MGWALALPTERVPAVYKPRQPRKTALYQLMETHYEDVKALWEDRFEKIYGRWRGFIDQAVWRYLRLWTIEKLVSPDSGAVIAVSNVYSLYPANKEGSVHRAMQNGPPPSPLFSKTSFLKMLATRCGPLRFPRCYGLISCITESFWRT